MTIFLPFSPYVHLFYNLVIMFLFVLILFFPFCYFVCFQSTASPEVEILSSRNASKELSPAQVPKADGASFVFPSGSSGGHQPRRMVLPGRYNSDPYVPQGNKFPVTAKERRHHLAMVQIGNHASWCKYVFLALCILLFSKCLSNADV